NVFGIGPLRQQPATDTQHHRAVPPQQRFEGGGIAPQAETLQQLAIGRLRVKSLAGPLTDVPQDDIRRFGGHGMILGWLYIIVFRGGCGGSTFLGNGAGYRTGWRRVQGKSPRRLAKRPSDAFASCVSRASGAPLA